MADTADSICVSGAREHNLRDVSLTLPKGRLICFTGVSGSGKSSLAFDTLYAEGQRRYIESLSSYARQFMGELPKPDVDQITGLAPSISIQQKTSGWNPRSTVGTITQIHDYLRVLMARAGDARCPQCGQAITAQTREHMLGRILSLAEGTRIALLAPKIRGQKGEHRDLFAELMQQGFVRARVDGVIVDLSNPPPLDRYRRHDIAVVIDRVIVQPGARARIAEALELALQHGDGNAIVSIGDESTGRGHPAGIADDPGPAGRGRRKRGGSSRAASADVEGADGDILLSAGYACTACGLSFEPPHPQMFSFNSPQGMCAACDGLGTKFDFDPELLVPDPSLNFLAPCVKALRTAPGRWRRHIYEGVARHVGFDLRTPWRDLPTAARRALLYGTGDAHITFEWKTRHGTWKHGGTFAGVIAELQDKHKKSGSGMVWRFYEQFMRQTVCPACRGARLSSQALAITLTGLAPDSGVTHGADMTQRASRDTGEGARDHARREGQRVPANVHAALNIDQICKLSISDALAFFDGLRLEGVRRQIADEPLKEIRARLRFLLDVGLDYLTLDRPAPTLSGGESQRIRLASQIGSGLVGVLYVLDEPSIGLHPRDNRRLLASLQKLRDLGNTVIVVEHDRDTMEAADAIVDFGPGPGVRGGRVVACGTIADVCAAEDSLTGAYLSGRARIDCPPARRPISRSPAEPRSPSRRRRRKS